ncbi:MAG TPA: ComEC/Rec2 family competence protein, partial [Lachnospiraceae bacterium]|nr:ComEC/Rec2 family competence protein [Lachnospiraceae bacterium]
HIAIMGLYFMKLLKKTGVPLYLSSLITITLMTCYGMMTGLSTSTFRALLMFLLGVFSICIKRTYDLLSAAAVSAMLILAENPYYLYDTAFQLSFGAIIGIGVFSPVVEMLLGLHKLDKKIAAANSGSMVKRKMGRGYYTVIRGMVKGIIASLSIQLATLPVIMQNFYQVPIYGTFINLIVVPLMSLLILTGIAAGAAGTIGLPDSIVGGILKISYVILRLYERLAKTGTGLGGNLWITGKPALWQIVLYVLLLLLIWILYSFRKKRNSGYPAAFAVCAVIAAAICILSVRKKEDFELRAISVGQGDCCFIKGKNTPVIIIDGGSSDEKQAGRYRILPCLKANAVHTVDYVFLSHLDSDHVNGIFEIMEDESSGIEIKRVIIPKTEAYFLSGEQEKSENYDRLVELAKLRNIPVYLFEAGDTISEGDIRIICLSPAVSDSTLWKNRTLNENSLVLQITYLPAGFQALFAGDISEDIEKELSDSLTHVHYLKAAHHGSKTATSEWFLEAVDPALTVLSAGRNNSYGHPHAETLERLKNRAFYITYDSGQVTVKIRQGKVTVSTFCADEN